MEFNEVLNKRRTHRVYIDKSIDRELVKEIIKASTKAPVSCNLQLNKYVVVDDQKLLNRLSKEVSYKFNYSPCTIVALYDKRFTIKRHSAVMTAGMAIENMILKATDIGLSTCPMAGFSKDNKIKKILGIPDHFDIILLLSLGYPDENVSIRDIPKIKFEQIYDFNKFSDLKSINDSDNLDKQSIEDIIDYRHRIAPVYLDRFRLKTWAGKYYEEVANFFSSKILAEVKAKNLLDVMSYDGEFLKYINKINVDYLDVSASDYLSNNLEYFREQFNCKINLIDNKNEILGVDDNTFDLMSFVFQDTFTPDLDKLISSINTKLKPGGYIFVATIRELPYKRFIKKIIKFYKKNILRETYNIYENNPYYKIGPVKWTGDKKIINTFKKRKLKLVDRGIIAKYPMQGLKIRFYLFKK